MSGTPQVTVHDVAAHAHVSAQTVSRVVNEAAGVAPATRALVKDAIRELGFTPDPVARSLRTGRSRRIGVLTHQLTATGPTSNTAAAMAELRAAGYDLDVIPLPEGEDDDVVVAAVAAAMTSFARSACAVMAMAQTEPVRDAVLAAAVPVPVYVDEHLGRGSGDVPGAEDLVGQAAAQHLLALGHRILAHLPGPASSLSGRYRAEVFTAAVRAGGGQCAVWPAGDWSAASGHAVTSRVDLAEVSGLSAVFVSNDAMAVGALRALRERGVDVPGQIAVLGVDDAPESAHTTPSLSSVHHDMAAEGRLAARVLLADLTGQPRPDPAAHLVVAVRARESTVRQQPVRPWPR